MEQNLDTEYMKLKEEILELKQNIKELEEILSVKTIQDNKENTSQEILLELLKEKNQKQSEVDELLVKLRNKDQEVCNYIDMYNDYKIAAEDRWERLQFYEKNILARILCSFNMKVKQKKSVSKNIDRYALTKDKYYGLYSEKERARFEWCKEKITTVSYRPLISLVVPVYNTDLQLLYELILSLKEQFYDNWEVCFANGSFENTELIAQLKKHAADDKRIRFKNLDKNGGISYNTNEAFSMGNGEFIGMLDHDDLLTPNALAEVIIALDENPELDFIYSDQDKVDEETTSRFGVLHKPGWSMETLYSGNYITHFSVVRTSLIEQIGLWDSSVDGAQDWDLFLKIAEKTDKIYAIPEVLYHWRTVSTSTALSMDTKQYALDAQIRSLQNHFDRLGYAATAEFANRKRLEIHIGWKEVPNRYVSIVVWDQGISDNLDSYIAFMRLELKDKIKDLVLISGEQERLDSVSQDCTKICAAYSEYAEAYNVGAKSGCGDIILFMTDRAVPVDTHTYRELIGWAGHKEIALVGPKVLYGNRSVNSMGILLNRDRPRSLFHKYDNIPAIPTEFGNTNWYRNVNAMDYYCFAIERKKFNLIGEFDVMREELAMIEYCLRARKTYRNLINPFAVVQYNVNFPKAMSEYRFGNYQKLLKDYDMPFIDTYYNPEFYEIEKQAKKRVVTWK